MRGLMPWTGMAGMKSEMDRLFDRFAELRWNVLAVPGHDQCVS